jgi:hypothetical protein
MVAITGSSKPLGYADFMICRHDPPDMYGITTHRLWSTTKEQCAFTTFGWLIKLIVFASRQISSCAKEHTERKIVLLSTINPVPNSQGFSSRVL